MNDRLDPSVALPDLAAIRAAHVRIEPHVHRTPVVTCAAIDAEVGATLFFKCENFQRIGAFKARGASNAVFSLTDDDWDAAMAANVTGPFLLTRGLAPAMAARGWGRIVNVASQQAMRAFGHSGAYGASKGAVVSLTRSTAERWSSKGVTCNALMPGFVITPLTAEASKDPVRVAAMAGRTMVGRNGQPDDFHGVTLLLASDAGAMITGSMVYVDGGFAAT